MAVNALNPGYVGEVRDAEENFHGNRVVYVHWEEHLMFCAALAFPLPPQMPFAALTGEVLAQFYGPHPQWKEIDWSTAHWTLNNEAFVPDPEKSLDDNGITHKSLLRLFTPGLAGHQGSAS